MNSADVNSDLGRNERYILDALLAAEGPASAYDLLEAVRPEGIKAPPTVYRALTGLIERGFAHRIESLNAFVACAHPQHHGRAGFAICESCGKVDEFHDEAVFQSLETWAKQENFASERATIEVVGYCKDCRSD